MEIIDLSKLEPQETLNHTSKGNQLKWKCDGYWYKADHMGYEGLAGRHLSFKNSSKSTQDGFSTTPNARKGIRSV